MACKFDNVDEMGHFLEIYGVPKLTQGETDNLNMAISIKGIESITNDLTKEKLQGPDGFTHEFYQIFKEEIIPILYNLFQRRETEGILPNSFSEASITLILKPNKDITRKKKTTDQCLPGK